MVVHITADDFTHQKLQLSLISLFTKLITNAFCG